MLFKRKPPAWLLSNIMTAEGDLRGTQIMAERPPVSTKDYPWLAYVTFEFEGRPLPTGDEMEHFHDLGLQLESLEATGEISNVAIMTMDGKRDFICYCRDRERGARLLMDHFGDEGAQLEFKFDPQWSQFRDLQEMRKG